MKKGNIKRQDWLSEKIRLEDEIKSYANAISSIPNGQSQSMEAGQARTRLESFIGQHGPVNELSDTHKRELEELKQEFEHKAKIAKETVARYEQAKSKLDRMKQELEALQLPDCDAKFSSSGLEILVRKSVEPWISKIEDTKARIAELTSKRTELKAEIARINPATKPLDEDGLLSADISKHHFTKKAEKESADKAQTARDLIQQLDQAINEKEKALSKLRSDFSRALRTITNQSVALAAGDIAKQFEQIIREDLFYSETFKLICNELIQKAGVGPDEVFGNLSLNIPDLATSPLRYKAKLMASMKQFINSVA